MRKFNKLFCDPEPCMKIKDDLMARFQLIELLEKHGSLTLRASNEGLDVYLKRPKGRLYRQGLLSIDDPELFGKLQNYAFIRKGIFVIADNGVLKVYASMKNRYLALFRRLGIA